MVDVADLDGVLTEKGLRVRVPSGDGCYYVGDEHPSEQMKHSYWRIKPDGDRGTRLSGVSTIAKIADLDPKHLMRWAAKTNGIGIATLVGPIILGLREGGAEPDELEWLTDHEDIWRVLEESKLTFDDVRDAKATVGTNVHELAFRALAGGRPVPYLERLTPEEVGYAQGVSAFFLDHDPQGDLVEQILVDSELGVAGRPDFIGTLGDSCGKPGCPCQELEGRGVVDAKTSNYIGAAYHLQVAGYRHLDVASGFGETEWSAVLKLSAEGGYELVRGRATPEGFIAAVDVYRDVGRINREAAADARARKKATEEASK